MSFLILSTNMPLRWRKKLSKYCRSGSATSVRSLILAARDSRTHSRPPSSRTAASRAQPVRGGQSRPEALRHLRQTKPPEFTLRITRRLPSLVSGCRWTPPYSTSRDLPRPSRVVLAASHMHKGVTHHVLWRKCRLRASLGQAPRHRARS